jgi:hypothetical protein
MHTEDEPLPPVPLTAGQLQPPIRRRPTAVGADDAELRWEDVRHLFPDCHLVATRFSDQTQASFNCWSESVGGECEIRVLVRSAWDPDSISTWLQRAYALQPLDLPCGPMVSHAGQVDRFAIVGQVSLRNTPLDDLLKRGVMARAPLMGLVDSLLETFALLHQAGVVHGRLTTRSIGCWASRVDLVDLLEPPAPAPGDAVDAPAPSVEDDLYQLAAIFYTAATGRRWLGPGTARDYLEKSAAEGPLAEAIFNLLDRPPDRRYQSAAAFRRALVAPTIPKIPTLLERAFGTLVWK